MSGAPSNARAAGRVLLQPSLIVIMRRSRASLPTHTTPCNRCRLVFVVAENGQHDNCAATLGANERGWGPIAARRGARPPTICQNDATDPKHISTRHTTGQHHTDPPCYNQNTTDRLRWQVSVPDKHGKQHTHPCLIIRRLCLASARSIHRWSTCRHTTRQHRSELHRMLATSRKQRADGLTTDSSPSRSIPFPFLPRSRHSHPQHDLVATGPRSHCSIVAGACVANHPEGAAARHVTKHGSTVCDRLCNGCKHSLLGSDGIAREFLIVVTID